MPSSFKIFVFTAFMLSKILLSTASDPTRSCRSTTAGKPGLELTGYKRLVSTLVAGCIRPAVAQGDEVYVVRMNTTSSFGKIFLNITKGDLFRSDCFYKVILTTAASDKDNNNDNQQDRLKWIVHISDEIQRSQLEIVTTADSWAVDFLTGEQASNRTMKHDVIETRTSNTVTISEMSTIAIQLTIGADYDCEDQGEMKEPDVSRMIRGSSLTPTPVSSCLTSPPLDGRSDVLRVAIDAQNSRTNVLIFDLEEMEHGRSSEDQIPVVFTVLLPKGTRLEVRSDPDRQLRRDLIFKTPLDVTIATHHLHVAKEFSITHNNTISINRRADIAAATENAAIENDSDVTIVFPDSVDVMRARFGNYQPPSVGMDKRGGDLMAEVGGSEKELWSGIELECGKNRMEVKLQNSMIEEIGLENIVIGDGSCVLEEDKSGEFRFLTAAIGSCGVHLEDDKFQLQIRVNGRTVEKRCSSQLDVTMKLYEDASRRTQLGKPLAVTTLSANQHVIYPVIQLVHRRDEKVRVYVKSCLLYSEDYQLPVIRDGCPVHHFDSLENTRHPTDTRFYFHLPGQEQLNNVTSLSLRCRVKVCTDEFPTSSGNTSSDHLFNLHKCLPSDDVICRESGNRIRLEANEEAELTKIQTPMFVTFTDNVDLAANSAVLQTQTVDINYPVIIIFGFLFVLVIFVIALFSKHIFSWLKSMSGSSTPTSYRKGMPENRS